MRGYERKKFKIWYNNYNLTILVTQEIWHYQRVFVTPKKNYVYYERTDINWNYWSDKTEYDSSFDLSDKNHNIIFEVTSELDDFSKYLDEEVIKKI